MNKEQRYTFFLLSPAFFWVIAAGLFIEGKIPEGDVSSWAGMCVLLHVLCWMSYAMDRGLS